MNLLGRLTDASELAEAALFLSQGWLASGETLMVDSGLHLVPTARDVLFMARAHHGVSPFQGGPKGTPNRVSPASP